MIKIPFEDGTLVKKGYVTIDGTEHEVEPAEYTGPVPMSAYNINKMQDNIENSINEEKLVKRPIIEGNSKQETREGYNKLQNSTTSLSVSGITGTIQNDESIKISGTATTSNGVYLVNMKKVNVKDIKDGDYTLSLKNETAIPSVSIRLRKSDGTTKTQIDMFALSEANKTRTLNLKSLIDDSTTQIELDIVCYSTSNYDFTLYPMLREGTEEKPYEQYGVSPSIDYPSEVKSVGDNINRLPTDESEWEQGTLIDGVVQASTTRIRTKNYVPIDILEQTISAISGQNYVYGNIFYYNTNKEYINNQYILSGSKDTNFTKLTFTPPVGTAYLKVVIKKKDDSTILPSEISSIKPKLTKGTSTGAYSPYGQGSIEIYNGNKNFFDKNNIVQGYFMSTSLYPNSEWCYSITNGLKAGETYTTSGGRCMLSYFNGNTNISVDDITNKTITIPENTTKVYISTLKTNVNTLQVEKGKIATEYIQGKSQTKALYTQKPFRAIGDVRDRFVKIDGKWYEQHNIARKIFDGSETWNMPVTNLYNVENILPNHITTFFIEGIRSNYYLGVQTRSDNNDFLKFVSNYDFACCLHHNGLGMRFKDTRNLDIAAFKSWLSDQYNAGTPLYVDYVLATPELIPCIPEQVEVLNDIYSAYGEGLTNITCTDEVEPVIEIIKETKETVQSNNDKAISALLERVSQLESVISSMQSTTAEGGA